jgi:tetratricopeptide (TPR) repeat protein
MQLKYWGSPVTFPDDFIKTCDTWPTRMPDGRVILVKDILIRHIIANNVGIEMTEMDYFNPQPDFVRKFVRGQQGKKTIYFATTVSDDNLEGFKPYLRLEGLVYRVVGDSSRVANEAAGAIETDIKKTEDFFYNRMRYTGIFYTEDFPFLTSIVPGFDARRRRGEFTSVPVFKDENTNRLLSNYAAGLFSLGYEYQRMGNMAKTKQNWLWAMRFRPERSIAFLYNLSTLYLQTNDFDSSLIYLRAIEAQGIRDAGIYFRIAGCYQALGNSPQAIGYLRKTIALQPRLREAYELLVGIYLNQDQTQNAIGVLNEWLSIAPQDSAARHMLEELTQNPKSGK